MRRSHAGVLGAIIAATLPGASTVALCKLGDELIIKETAAVYNKKVEGKATEKGVGFPTCISVNHLVCHNSPLATEPEEFIKEGDVVKMCVAAFVVDRCAGHGRSIALLRVGPVISPSTWTATWRPSPPRWWLARRPAPP